MTEPIKSSNFSNFFRNATSEEKEKVVLEAVRAANKEQKKVMDELNSLKEQTN